MELTNPQNQSYWFVVREDPNNILLTSNNFTLHTPQITEHEATYVVDTVSDNHEYIQVEEPVIIQAPLPEVHDKGTQKDDIFWDRDKVREFLSLCLDVRFNCDASESRWDEIALLLGTTPEECDIKFTNLRKTYLRLLTKKRLGKVIKWVHYGMAEQLFKDCAALEIWEDITIRKMLGLYIDKLSEFENPSCVHKNLWKVIAAQLNTTYLECYQKFISLRKSYFKLKKKYYSEKNIDWPYYDYFKIICRNYSPAVKPWTTNKIKLLIKAYLEIARKFIDTKYQKKDLWKQISRKVGETASDCDKKFRNLKQTYVRLKMKADSGRTIKWEHYQDFVNIFENDSYLIVDEGSEIVFKLQQDYIKHLLKFYIENKGKFKDPLVKNYSLWKTVAPSLGMTPGECDKKFRNLKQTYIRLAEKKRDTGKSNGWPYYSYFEQIYGNTEIPNMDSNNVNVAQYKRKSVSAQQDYDREKFKKLVMVMEDSNRIQRERNRILQALLEKK